MSCRAGAKLPDYVEALGRALSTVRPLKNREELPLHSATRRVLASAVVADRDLPPFDRAQMDGYALRGKELGHRIEWRVAGTIAAGQPGNLRVADGECVKIATGAPVPRDLDTVIPHELSNRGDPVRFTIQTIEQWHAVHRRGSDAKKGGELIRRGTVLGAHHLGIAAAVGMTALSVVKRPRAVVLSSGDEVRPVGAEVDPHQIRNSNGVQTMELLSRFGADAVTNRHVPDEQSATDEAVQQAIGEAELLVTIGGISAGDRDCFPEAFLRAGIELVLRGASIQPGRPILVGHASSGTVVVGLPGNPVSSLACACLFVWPMVRAMLGLSPDLPWRLVNLREAVRPNEHRQAFRPAILCDHGGWALVPPWAGSGDLCHTATTHGLVELPVQGKAVAQGTALRFLDWPS